MKPIFDDFLADLDRKKEPKASRLVVIDHFSDVRVWIEWWTHCVNHFHW